MKAFRKDFFREILRNKGRFLSVFFISLLGAAFFSGIRSAEGDMKTSADAYYDQTNYMDLRVLGTLGLTDTDMEDIAKVAQAMHDLFHPDKVNYGAYGDTGHHLHFHLVPKYKDQYEWGGVFAMNPGEKKLTDEEYDEMVKRYQEKLVGGVNN